MHRAGTVGVMWRVRLKGSGSISFHGRRLVGKKHLADRVSYTKKMTVRTSIALKRSTEVTEILKIAT